MKKKLVKPEPKPQPIEKQIVEGQQEEAPKEGEIIPILIKSLTGATLQTVISKQDPPMEIRQFLSESAETCYITHFDLYLGNVKLKDYVEPKFNPEIKSMDVIEMREVPYDEKASRYQLYRFRELLESRLDQLTISKPEGELPSAPDAQYPSFSTFIDEATETKELEESFDCDYSLSDSKFDSRVNFETEKFSLKAFVKLINATSSPVAQMIKSINFGGWNPAPGNRRLQGDFYYLVLETIEGKKYHITAGPNGFALNNSTDATFSPSLVKKTTFSPTLTTLVMSLSKHFSTVFPQVLNMRTKKHPYEVLQAPIAPFNWIQTFKNHTFDACRAEESQFKILGHDPRIQHRDWNEEFQTCKDLPHDKLEDRVIRERNLYRIHCEFVEAAKEGVKAIVNKTILPLNLGDAEPSQIFVQNGIFYSFSVDNKNPEKAFFGDEIAYQHSNNDLNGIRSINEVDTKDVYTLVTALINFKGYRVLCQSMPPGILSGETGTKHVYGSVDEGKKFNTEEKYQTIMSGLSTKLQTKEFIATDSEKKEYKLHFPVDCKGIVAGDNRFYILEICRTSPRDANFLDRPTACIRRELISRWYLKKFVEEMKLRQEENTKSTKSDDIKEETTKSEEIKEEKKEEIKEEKKIEINLQFNLAAFTDIDVPQEDKDAVKELSDWLKNAIVIEMAKQFSKEEIMILDGEKLSATLHDRGINVRYLGEIATLMTDAPHNKLVFEQEMFVRAAKHEFATLMRNTPITNQLKGIEKFLNSMWTSEAILALIQSKFGYKLTKMTPNVHVTRTFCRKVGLVLSGKDFNFGSQPYFVAADLIDFEPVVKHTVPTSHVAVSLLEAANHELNMGAIESALVFLQEAIQTYYQTHGPISLETAGAYLQLGNVMHALGDYQQAILTMHKALLIIRKISGHDSSEVAQLHHSIGVMCTYMRQPKYAIKHFLRARSILQLVHGSEHPLMHILLQDMAQTYLLLNAPIQANAALKQSLEIIERLYGKDNLKSAIAFVTVGSTLASQKRFKDALEYEKKANKILETVLGRIHESTVESQKRLEVYTQNAVKIQKESVVENFKQQQKLLSHNKTVQNKK
jgi:protein TIF31